MWRPSGQSYGINQVEATRARASSRWPGGLADPFALLALSAPSQLRESSPAPSNGCLEQLPVDREIVEASGTVALTEFVSAKTGKSTGVFPREFFAAGSARLRSNNLQHFNLSSLERRPRTSQAASCRGVFRSWLAALMSAPAANKALTQSRFPHSDARCSGVDPLSFRASTSAPASMSLCKMATLPASAASCSGVWPTAFRRLTFAWKVGKCRLQRLFCHQAPISLRDEISHSELLFLS